MCWGIACGVGWYEIIDELCGNLHKLFTELELTGEDYPAVEQVKEKYGTLRFYIDLTRKMSSDDKEKVYQFIRNAEHRSSITCEKCGKPGEEAPGSWIKILCGVCRKPNTNQ